MFFLCHLSDDEIAQHIEPMIENMLAGSTARDHARHVADYTDRLKVIVTERIWLRNVKITNLALAHLRIARG